MTPREIVRFALVQNDLFKERDIHMMRLEYMNAALQRSKKMPKFDTLVKERKPATLSEIAQKLNLPRKETGRE